MRSIAGSVHGCLVLAILISMLVIAPHTASAAEGDVWGWGENAYGKIGNGNHSSGDEANESQPVETSAIPGEVVAIDAGAHFTLALTAAGTVYAWGFNDYWQLGRPGTGDDIISITPVQIDGLSNITAISAGVVFGLALDADGHVWAWGDNTFGQLGSDSVVGVSLPIMIDGLEDITAISAGGFHALALDADGRVHAWGLNTAGQLGNGLQTTLYTPTPVAALDGIPIAQVAGGNAQSFAVTQTGSVFAWGSNHYGQLGDGTASATLTVTPKLIPSLSNIVRVESAPAGWGHTLALTDQGTLLSWGSNESGEVGAGSDDPVIPTPVAVMTDVASMAAGGYHSVVLTTAGVAWAWGLNADGQLGDGTTTSRNSPTPVATTLRFSMVTAGAQHTIALRTPDSTPPAIAPLNNQVLDPVDQYGAPVVFTVTATDDQTPSDQIEIACTDQDNQAFESGDIAPIGTTTISCSATDAAGHTSSASFTVTVRSAADLVDDLRALIDSTGLGATEKRTMLTYVGIIDGAIDGGNPQLACMATNTLDLYVRSQESRRRIPAQQARLLNAQTALIRTVHGCGGQV